MNLSYFYERLYGEIHGHSNIDHFKVVVIHKELDRITDEYEVYEKEVSDVTIDFDNEKLVIEV